MVNRLIGKVAIITGGGTGIGSGIARVFVSEGANIVICGRTKETLDKTVQEAKGGPGKIIPLVCDISESEQVENTVQKTVENFGKINILINNAGVGGNLKNLVELTEEEWDKTFSINAKGTWLVSKYVIPEMIKAGGGSIILISSVSAFYGQKLNDCYNASKAAEEMIIKNIALDFAKDKIRANSICPAWVATEENKLEDFKNKSEMQIATGIKNYSELIKMHPIGRLGTPEDIAWAAVYLASDESTWVTGASFMIDGGYTCI
ncbi:MAG: SDR family oxidoreductase [Actinobacteria bacterium]|nr:SDR family oxidoreductase [Actinomycetota bacterium]